MNLNNLITELKRRNVFKVATAYAITGWLLIQIIATVTPQLGFPEWVPSFFTVMILVGFPLAIIFAWAFELTPEGLRKSTEVDITESVTQATGKKINMMIISVLSVAVVFLLVERIFFAKANILDNNNALISNASIAVLPFVNMSSDQNNEYFSDGLSEELLNGLAKIENLKVAGRTSSFQFKGTNPDLRDVGRQLGVKNILEGSVRKSGTEIRITAQLIQADNGFHMWSETYDRELTAEEIFDIQEEITRKVVEELKIRLLPNDEARLTERPTKDIEAYNAFLEATQLEVNRNADELERAIVKYKEAVRIDPTFSLAYARMAYAYGLLLSYGNMDLDEARFQMRSNIEQALLLDENQGKAYQARALYYIDIDRDEDKALEAALKAVELLPNDPLVWNMLSVVHERREEYEKQDSVSYKAYQLDPLSPTIAGNWVLMLTFNERYQEAYQINERLLQRNPGYTNGIVRKADLLKGPSFGQLDSAFIILYDAYLKTPDNYFILDGLYEQALDLNMRKVAEFFKNRLQDKFPNNRSVNGKSIQLALYDHDYERALELVDSFSARYGEQFGQILVYPIMLSYYGLDRIDEVIPFMEAAEPSLTDPDIKVDRNFNGQAINYSRVLEMVGRPERARIVREAALKTFEEDLAIIRDKNLIAAATDLEGRIAEIKGDLETAVQKYEETYFSLKGKNNWVWDFELNDFTYDQYEELASFQDFKRRVNEDVSLMRLKVEQYLKAKGEWRDEWDVQN